MTDKIKKIIKIVKKADKEIRDMEQSADTTLDADVIKTIKAIAYEEIAAIARQMLKILKKERE